MTVIINGTTGITSVNGSAGAPSVTGTDTDTGIVYGTNTLSLATGGTERVRVDSSGNVGIGTSSPSSYGLLAVNNSSTLGTAADNTNVYVRSANRNAGISLDGAVTNTAFLQAYSAGSPTGSIQFWGASSANPNVITINGKGSNSEVMRIDSSGNLLVGLNSALVAGTHEFANTSNGGFMLLRNSNAVAGRYFGIGPDANNNMVVYNQGSLGVYMTNGGSSWLPNSSDERLKNKVGDIEGALEAINKLAPLKYFFKSEEQTGVPRYGFFAQNVGEAIPDAMLVSPVQDEELGEIYTYSAEIINVYLVKAIQEQQAIIEQLRADVAALKAKA